MEQRGVRPPKRRSRPRRQVTTQPVARPASRLATPRRPALTVPQILAWADAFRAHRPLAHSEVRPHPRGPGRKLVPSLSRRSNWAPRPARRLIVPSVDQGESVLDSCLTRFRLARLTASLHVTWATLLGSCGFEFIEPCQKASFPMAAVPSGIVHPVDLSQGSTLRVLLTQQKCVLLVNQIARAASRIVGLRGPSRAGHGCSGASRIW